MNILNFAANDNTRSREIMVQEGFVQKFSPIVAREGTHYCFFCDTKVEVRSNANTVKYYHPVPLCYAWRKKFNLIMLVHSVCCGGLYGVLEQSMIDELLEGKYGNDVKQEMVQFLASIASKC